MSQSPKSKKTKAAQAEARHAARRIQIRLGWFSATVAILLLLLGSATAYAFRHTSRYLPRTVVSGVPIGSMTREQATVALQSRIGAFEAATLNLHFRDKSWEMTPNELGTAIDPTATLDKVWMDQKAGPWYQQLGLLFAAPLRTTKATVPVQAVSDAGAQLLKDRVLGTVETAFEETRLDVTSSGATVVTGKPGEKWQRTTFETTLAELFVNGKREVTLSVEPSQPEVTTEMAEPARARAAALVSKPLKLTLGKTTFTFDQPTLVHLLGTEVARTTTGEATGLSLAFTADLNPLLDGWIASVNKAPTNARLGHGDDGKVTVVTNDSPGEQVARPATVEALLAYLNSNSTTGTVTGVTELVAAAVRPDTLASLGITELIGTANTDFTGSPNNRKFNITKGAQGLDRKLVKPAEVFSTVGALAPIEESNGYLPELVIKGNRTIPEAGGGLCQVSTTLFRSVLNAGLPVVERQNHAYRVSYYERGVGPGLDATIYDPNPDFKWKNDFSTSVYIQSAIKGNVITFELFGTKDGRQSTIGTTQILETYPVGEPIYVNTDTLPKGETRQIEKPHDGAKTSVTYSVTRGGKEIFKRTFISVYRAWPAQFLVGTAEPTPPPA